MTIYKLTNSEDTQIKDKDKNHNFGSCVEFDVGTGSYPWTRRGLIRFPLDTIPGGVITVNSAILSVMCKAQKDGSDRLMTAYRSLVQWYEGVQCNSDVGEEDGSTWNMRNANSLEQLYWEGGIGTGGASGSDWFATKTDDVLITGTNQRFELEVKADVDKFLDNTYQNFGWFLIGVEGSNETRKTFYSNQSETEDYRPTLTLDLDFSLGSIPAGVEECCDGSNYYLMERKGIVP